MNTNNKTQTSIPNNSTLETESDNISITLPELEETYISFLHHQFYIKGFYLLKHSSVHIVGRFSFFLRMLRLRLKLMCGLKVQKF